MEGRAVNQVSCSLLCKVFLCLIFLATSGEQQFGFDEMIATSFSNQNTILNMFSRAKCLLLYLACVTDLANEAKLIMIQEAPLNHGNS